ncbi:hypothetical protein T439DRAFT_374490 [Meredithblackwellia eburnea MCA 4105]
MPCLVLKLSSVHSQPGQTALASLLGFISRDRIRLLTLLLPVSPSYEPVRDRPDLRVGLLSSFALTLSQKATISPSAQFAPCQTFSLPTMVGSVSNVDLLITQSMRFSARALHQRAAIASNLSDDEQDDLATHTYHMLATAPLSRKSPKDENEESLINEYANHTISLLNNVLTITTLGPNPTDSSRAQDAAPGHKPVSLFLCKVQGFCYTLDVNYYKDNGPVVEELVDTLDIFWRPAVKDEDVQSRFESSALENIKAKVEILWDSLLKRLEANWLEPEKRYDPSERERRKNLSEVFERFSSSIRGKQKTLWDLRGIYLESEERRKVLDALVKMTEPGEESKWLITTFLNISVYRTQVKEWASKLETYSRTLEETHSTGSGILSRIKGNTFHEVLPEIIQHHNSNNEKGHIIQLLLVAELLGRTWIHERLRAVDRLWAKVKDTDDRGKKGSDFLKSNKKLVVFHHIFVFLTQPLMDLLDGKAVPTLEMYQDLSRTIQDLMIVEEEVLKDIQEQSKKDDEDLSLVRALGLAHLVAAKDSYARWNRSHSDYSTSPIRKPNLFKKK